MASAKAPVEKLQRGLGHVPANHMERRLGLPGWPDPCSFLICVGIGSAHLKPTDWVPHGKERLYCQKKQRADAEEAKQQMSTTFMDEKKQFAGHDTWAKQ